MSVPLLFIALKIARPNTHLPKRYALPHAFASYLKMDVVKLKLQVANRLLQSLSVRCDVVVRQQRKDTAAKSPFASLMAQSSIARS